MPTASGPSLLVRPRCGGGSGVECATVVATAADVADSASFAVSSVAAVASSAAAAIATISSATTDVATL